MYLYYDRAGVLKEIVSDIPGRATASNVNKIYVYVEGIEDDSDERLWVRYEYSYEGEPITTAETEIENRISVKIPYDQKRDLKFFKYFQYYPFFVTIVPDEVLGESGTVAATFSLVRDIYGDGASDIDEVQLSRDELLPLGLFTFKVEKEVGENLGKLAHDGYVSISQFNYLLKRVSSSDRFAKFIRLIPDANMEGDLTEDELLEVRDNKINRLVYGDIVYYYSLKDGNTQKYFSVAEQWHQTIYNEVDLNVETGHYEIVTTVNKILQDHIDNTNVHVTITEKTFWNNKVSAEVSDDILILSKD